MGLREVAFLLFAVACGTRDTDAGGAASDSVVVTGSGHVFANKCEGEGCQPSYQAVACRDVPLVASPTKRATVGTLKRGDTADVATDLHLKKPGIVVLQRDLELTDDELLHSSSKPTWKFAAGDTVFLLSYVGEGFWDVSYKGRETQLQEFWAGPNRSEWGPEDSAQSRVAIGTLPVIDTWLRVARGGRVIGWLLQDTTNAIAPIGGYAEKWALSCSTAARP